MQSLISFTDQIWMERIGKIASGLGTHVYPWQIHVNVWQNQYSIVKQKKKQPKHHFKSAPW